MRCLAIDSVTGVVVDKLSQAGIRAILLKGASIARWLYSEDEPRTYGDVDLLVSPAQFDQAERLLEDQGFRHLLAGATSDEMTSTHSWLSPGEERVTVELHRTFHDIGTSEECFWREISTNTDKLAISGHELETPDEAARCLLLALHVGHHGKEFSWPLRDLELAVQRVQIGTWTRAAALAERLQALSALAAGLRVIPDGIRLAETLDLPVRVSAALVIQTENMPKVTRNLERLALTDGMRAKTVFVARKLFPTSAWMRYEYRLGDCGRMRLSAAYVWRFLQLIRDLPASALAWSRARRRAARLGDR